MTDDAQPPAAPQNDAVAPGGAASDGGAWTPPQWPQDAADAAPLDAGAIPEVGRDTQVGAAGAPGVPLDKGAAADARGPAPDPWAAPDPRTDTVAASGGGPGTPVPPSVHDQQTVTSLPAPDASPWAAPAAPPATGAPAPFPPPNPALGGPFAPPGPAAPGPLDVPPPPIGPDGPGQVPYGYPAAGYGHPAPQPSYGYPAPQPAHGGQHTHGAPGYYGWPGGPAEPSNGLGTAGMVVGIIAAAGFCLWPLAILLGALAVIFGGIGRAKANRGEATNPGQALAGIICGAVGLVLGVLFGVLVVLAP
ncbi:DUF4190 domain-containing protein [Streptomyces cinereospinus]|uniref:DUF4190 domain-containing protein n=1 Tax=Streptomyces cinereospinus TaxID=285561 RepID=A0ABV5N749_9ACTN